MKKSREVGQGYPSNAMPNGIGGNKARLTSVKKSAALQEAKEPKGEPL